MHPELFSVFGITIHTYGVMVAAGFLAGMALLRKRALKKGFNTDRIFDLVFYILIGSIIGARGVYVIFEPEHFLNNPLSVFKVWEGGLVFSGGLITGIIVFIFYAKRHFTDLWEIADCFAPCLPLGHFIGRFGCFFAGCCYGKPTDLPWGITFSDMNALAPLNIHLHPTQLYESGACFLIFLFLLWRSKKTLFNGHLILEYLMLYGSARFFIEFLRGDFRGSILGSVLSTTQIISILLITAALVLWLKKGLKRA